MNRRSLLNRAALATTAAAFSPDLLFPRGASAQLPRAEADPTFTVPSDSKIKHSVMAWCFGQHPDEDKRLNADELAPHCAELGFAGMEGCSADHYPLIKELGMGISLVSGGHGFQEGPCNPEFRTKVSKGLIKGIDLAKEVGSPSVITFTGMRYDGMDDDEAAQGCVDIWKKAAEHAEEQGITLVLEHLNSRDDSHPMKGHPGYFGDDVDFCAELISRVDSPNFKLLFDVYHVSVMNGDVIRRIGQYQDIIGHYHTAGNPGRGELDDTQEINYPAVMRAIAETGYDGYIAHEFIPNWDDPIASLRHGAEVCEMK